MIVQPVYFHADLDAFFAAVEQLDHPEYRGKPVIVGGEKGKRGVVSTCSYEARKYGVHSAMPTARAESLCPNGIFIRGRMERYHEKSQEVMAVFSRWSPSVQQISIDEAFIDMSGTERLFGPVAESAQALKQDVLNETGLTVSVGVGPNRYISKIASGLSKPDGLTIVAKGEEKDFIASLRLKDVWGIGEKTRSRLEDAGLGSIALLLNCSQSLLQGIIGNSGGSFLYQVLKGSDPRIYTGIVANRSISSEHTFPVDICDTEILETTLLELCSDIYFRMLDEDLCGKTIHVKIRYDSFKTVSIQDTSEYPFKDMDDLFMRARELFRKKYERGIPVRLVGIGVHKVKEAEHREQMDLFADGSTGKRRLVEEAVHKLEQKRKKNLVTRARLLPQPGKNLND